MHLAKSRLRVLTPLLACLPLLVASSAAADWERFRGPNGLGAGGEAGAIDKLDDPGFEVVWKIPIGSGYSGVAVADGKVFTLFSEGEVDVAAAFDQADGKRLWTYEIAPIYKGHDGSHDGPIATPLVADGRMFGIGPRGQFFALDTATGEELWRYDLTEAHGIKKPHYGFATSPILESGHLIVQLGGEGKAVGAFDPKTGDLRWQSGDDAVSYQAPITITAGGQRQVIAAGDEKLLAIDPADGKVLWEHSHGGNGARGAGSITPVPTGPNRYFLAYRDDGSTLLEVAEDGTAAAAWESRTIRNSYNVPVHHDGHLYAYSSRFLTCVDAASGESVWRSRQPGDGFLIAVDGHLVIVTKKGRLELVEASSEAFKPVTGIQLFDDIAWTSPSFSNGQVYARSLGELARVDLRSGITNATQTASKAGDGSPFGAFLTAVGAAATEDDKKAVVDRFFAEQKTFPILEGDSTVHFVYRGPAKDVAVAGDMFGARREESMTRIAGTDVHYFTWTTDPDARVNYLFIEDFEHGVDDRNPRRSSTTLLTKEMEMSFSTEEMPMSWLAMPKWKAPAHLEAAEASRQGRVTGHQVESKVMEGKVDVRVYVPAGYDGSGDTRYPVVFFHDATAETRGAVANSLDNLIGTSVEPVIAAFVNIQARGPNYGQVFAGEVVPFVDSTYRTRTEASHRANHGNAFQAVGAFASTVSQPDQFSKVALQSPFLFTQMEAMVNQLVDGIETAEAAPQIYLEWGKYDLRNPHEGWDMAAAGRRFAERLK
ncbi:MAG: PQQ-binding-like beta-propeller repeat protein, partial [Acidobacteriota bacterium]